MTDEELIIQFALTRLDNPDLDLEEIAALVVRRMGPDRVLEFASRNLATRGVQLDDVTRGPSLESFTLEPSGSPRGGAGAAGGHPSTRGAQGFEAGLSSAMNPASARASSMRVMSCRTASSCLATLSSHRPTASGRALEAWARTA